MEILLYWSCRFRFDLHSFIIFSLKAEKVRKKGIFWCVCTTFNHLQCKKGATTPCSFVWLNMQTASMTNEAASKGVIAASKWILLRERAHHYVFTIYFSMAHFLMSVASWQRTRKAVPWITKSFILTAFLFTSWRSRKIVPMIGAFLDCLSPVTKLFVAFSFLGKHCWHNIGWLKKHSKHLEHEYSHRTHVQF